MGTRFLDIITTNAVNPHFLCLIKTNGLIGSRPTPYERYSSSHLCKSHTSVGILSFLLQLSHFINKGEVTLGFTSSPTTLQRGYQHHYAVRPHQQKGLLKFC